MDIYKLKKKMYLFKIKNKFLRKGTKKKRKKGKKEFTIISVIII